MRIRSNSELIKMMPKRKVLQFNDVAHCGPDMFWISTQE